MKVRKLIPTKDEFVIYLNSTELATMVNAMEDAALHYAEGSEAQMDVDGLILEITSVTGY